MNYMFLSKYSGWEIILIGMVSLMLFFMGINESSYISISIRNFFIFSFFSLLLITLSGISSIAGKSPYSISLPSIGMLIWLVFIVIQATVTGKMEEYYFLYYSLSIFLFLSATQIYRLGKFDFKHVYKLFFILGVIEAVVCILQFSGIVSSHDTYFKVKGTFDNPNTTAMYMVGCVPFALSTLLKRQSRIVLIVSLLMMLTALIIINCRTAYLGLLVVVVVYLFFNLDFKNYINSRGITKAVILIIMAAIILTATSFYLYKSKKASADGRVFIWKVSTEMIAQKPVLGYGYGFFQKEYNLFQAEYFSTHQTTDEEKLHASYVFMPYNDMLEQAIQGGMVGAIIYLVCMGMIIYHSMKRKLMAESALILSFFAMSCTNYGIQAIPLWTLFLLCAASVASVSEKQTVRFT